jgi:hypothetical protein
MAVAALIISLASALTALAVLIFARQSAAAAIASARAAETSAEASRTQAVAALEQLAIERERFRRESAPILAGAMRQVLSLDHPMGWELLVWPMTGHLCWLRVKIALNVPVIGRDGLMKRELTWASAEGGTLVTVRSPARWPVIPAGVLPVRFELRARCVVDLGDEPWDGVPVMVEVADRFKV